MPRSRKPRNPFDVLGIAHDATPARIKAAYRKLAKEFHPDTNPGDELAEARFREIQEAYEALTSETPSRTRANAGGADDDGDARGQAPNLDPIPSPNNPTEVACWLIEKRFGGIAAPRLRTWRGDLYEWRGPHWTRMDEPRFGSVVREETQGRYYLKGDKLEPWHPTRSKVKGVLWGVESLVNVDDPVMPPTWLENEPEGLVIPCRNGLLSARTRKLADHTPSFFNTFSLPFAYEREGASAECARWDAFLKETWPDDSHAIDLLGEWFGYIISGRLELQKGLLLLGPKRSGKGTITRVLEELVGKDNVGAPLINTLKHSTGLEDVRDKTLALIPDARLDSSQGAVQLLLAVIGQDRVSVNAKAKARRTQEVPARFVISSNEVPALGDASAAVVSRFLILRTTVSHIGKEDVSLGKALRKELPGILNWSLDGLDRLERQGAFSTSLAAVDVEREMEELASPVKAFVDTCLILDPDATSTRTELFDAWCLHAKRVGQPKGTKEVFGRNLKAFLGSSIWETRPRKGRVRERGYRGVKIRQGGSDE